MYKRLEFQNALKKTAEAATKIPSGPKLLRILKSIDDRLFKVERGGKAVQILAVARGKVMNI